MSMDIIQLAHHIKEVRDMQKAYFDSRNGRYADRALLDAAKVSERNLDKLVSEILTSPDPSQIIDGKSKEVSIEKACTLRVGDAFRMLGKRKVYQVKKVFELAGRLDKLDEVLIIVEPKCRQIVLPSIKEIVIVHRAIP